MKILYGVNGTGNGHITRSRIMVKELKKSGHQVDFLISGIGNKKLYDMKEFGDYILKEGMTFVVEKGKINYIKTLFNNNILTLFTDIMNQEVNSYDLIISDFEPITAWASYLSNKECIGIGHQYAFNYNIPKSHNNILLDKFMKWFAPVSTGFGLHWDKFNSDILPPIIDINTSKIVDNKILLYLPFESVGSIMPILIKFTNYEFYYYGTEFNHSYLNIHFKQQSLYEFQKDLKECEGVICNAGFELPSEAIHLGKKLLVKPVIGQFEQHSNALALEQLGYGEQCASFTTTNINYWLKSTNKNIKFPNVARHLVKWLETRENLSEFCNKIWDKT